MNLRNSAIFLFTILLIQCKSTGDVSQASDVQTPIILLLTENLSPADLESVKSMQIESMKKISRTQNLWMLKVPGEIGNAKTLIGKLKGDERVIKASLENDESDTSNKTKSGKSDPIKN